MKRVLIVEDNKDVAEVFGQFVELAGCDAKLAYDGRQALNIAKSWLPELILCDLGLPGEMSGLDFVRACKSDPDLRAVTAVAISGFNRPEDRAAAQEAGFSDLVGKPISFDTIQALCMRTA